MHVYGRHNRIPDRLRTGSAAPISKTECWHRGIGGRMGHGTVRTRAQEHATTSPGPTQRRPRGCRRTAIRFRRVSRRRRRGHSPLGRVPRPMSPRRCARPGWEADVAAADARARYRHADVAAPDGATDIATAMSPRPMSPRPIPPPSRLGRYSPRPQSRDIGPTRSQRSVGRESCLIVPPTCASAELVERRHDQSFGESFSGDSGLQSTRLNDVLRANSPGRPSASSRWRSS